VDGSWWAVGCSVFTLHHDISYTAATMRFLPSIIAQMFAFIHILVQSHELHELDGGEIGRLARWAARGKGKFRRTCMRVASRKVSLWLMS